MRQIHGHLMERGGINDMVGMISDYSTEWGRIHTSLLESYRTSVVRHTVSHNLCEFCGAIHGNDIVYKQTKLYFMQTNSLFYILITPFLSATFLNPKDTYYKYIIDTTINTHGVVITKIEWQTDIKYTIIFFKKNCTN